jgi:hypothetical protein
MTQHTKAPWRVAENFMRFMKASIVADGDNGNLVIAHIDNVDGFDGDSYSNARLIAAAPELLGACKSALRALEDNLQPGCMDEEAKVALRLVIAKAEGKPWA